MTGRRTGQLAGLVLVLAALAAYGRSLRAPFVFDDRDSIVGNPTITHLAQVGRVLSPPSSSGQTVGGRPLLNLSLAVDYAIGGLDVESYHLTNLLIHVLAGLALFGLIRRTLGGRAGCPNPPDLTSGVDGANGALGTTRPTRQPDPGREAMLLAFGVALLWTLHPLQTEAVTYVVQRAESLMGLFYLLTLYGFVRGVEGNESGQPAFAKASAGEKAATRRSVAWFGLSWLACLFGMATKEVMVSAPVIVFLYDRTFVSGSFGAAWRRHGRVHAALAATWLLLPFLVLPNHQRGGSTGFGSGVSWESYLLTQFPAVLRYLRLSVWPHPLIFDYGTRWTLGPMMMIVAVILVLALLAATAAALVRPARGGWGWRAWGFAGAWFFAILAPTSLIPGNRQTLAEHRMYLALAPVLATLVLGAVAAVSRVRRRPVAGWAVLAPCLFLAAGAGALTARRNGDYRSNLALWSDTVAKLPTNPYAQADLGVALDQQGDEEGALARYTEALRLKPDLKDLHHAHDDMGLALAKLGRVPEARAEFELALRYQPNFAQAHSDLGNVLRLEGRLGDAEAEFREAIRIQPDLAVAWLNLGLVCTAGGRWPEAIAAYRQAEALQPGEAETHLRLADVLAQSGRLPEAVAEYREVLRLDPDRATAHDHLGHALAELGQAEASARELAEAVRLASPR